MIARACIERLYRVFKGYLPDTLDEFSPLNNPELMAHWSQVLRARPLRELHAEDLRYYTFKAMTTWGDTSTFKHFLPRLLELIGPGKGAAPDLELVFQKITYSNWRSWPKPEQESIEWFCAELWQAVSAPTESGCETQIGPCLLAFSSIGLPILPLLTRWMQQDGEGPLLRLCQFIEEEAPSLLRRKNKGPDTGLQDWLSAPALKEHLTEAFFRHADTHHATTLSRALQVLEQSG